MDGCGLRPGYAAWYRLAKAGYGHGDVAVGLHDGEHREHRGDHREKVEQPARPRGERKPRTVRGPAAGLVLASLLVLLP